MTLDLGTTSLSQARLARGLTLEDAERSTRISRKFLIALEEHDYSVFPAPIYARGFLRTYCRYLGVDPERQLAELPAGWTGSTQDVELKPVSTRGPMTFNLAWLVAGVMVVAVLGLGLFLTKDSQDAGTLAEQPGDQSQLESAAGSTAAGSQTEPTTAATQPTSTSASSSSGRLLEPGLPGILPDFTEVAANDVTDFLQQQGIAYLRIDTASSTTPAGLVMRQSPAAGSATSGLGQVTLTVSTGPTPVERTRSDCSVLESTNQRTASEQTYFEANCTSEPDPTAEALPDRTNCEEIRGTDYRSLEERSFFLANCVIQ